MYDVFGLATIARNCSMEAEGKAWDENPAVYGHLSMQVDFIVSAKMHCQFLNCVCVMAEAHTVVATSVPQC